MKSNKSGDNKQLVRIKHWQQETIESGRFVLSGLMSLKAAKKIINDGFVEDGTIVPDSEFTYKKEGV